VIRIVVSNQRGGVAKTTTAVNLARCFADRSLRTLLIDTDSQGSISTILGLKPQFTLHDFLIRQMVLKECVVRAHGHIDVLCSDRKTMQAEDIISGQTLREVHFEQVFGETGADEEYDAVVIDVVHPSIRATAASVLSLTRNLFGLAGGPLLAGLLSDVYGLRIAMAVVPLFCLIAAAFFLRATRTYSKDVVGA